MAAERDRQRLFAQALIRAPGGRLFHLPICVFPSLILTSAHLSSLRRIIRREQTAPLWNTGPSVAGQPHTDLMEWKATSEASVRTASMFLLDPSPR